MSETNDASNESNSLSSDSTQLSSRSGGGATGGGGNLFLRASVLRPSVLGSSGLGSALASASKSTDAPSPPGKGLANAVHNPFLKEQNDEEGNGSSVSVSAGVSTDALNGSSDKDKTKAKEEATATTVAGVAAAAAVVNDKKAEDDEEPDERPDPLTLLRKNGFERANLFAAAKSSIPRVEKSGFVFGQNVHERVVGDNIYADSHASHSGGNTSTAGDSSGELLFSSVIQNANANKVANESEAGSAGGESGGDGTAGSMSAAAKSSGGKSLDEVAREYEESRAQKRKYEEVETFTGEENEVNIVDINCKLFAFISGNWEERGRGSLRLNFSKNDKECARLVFRSSGNLRLLLNTKVWAGMVADRASQKSLRITAMDNTGKIKIFLVMSRPGDIQLLFKALSERIELRKLTHPEELQPDHDGVADNASGGDSKNGSAVSSSSDGGNSSHDGQEDVKIKTTAAVTESKDDNESGEPCPKKTLVVGSDVSSTETETATLSTAASTKLVAAAQSETEVVTADSASGKN